MMTVFFYDADVTKAWCCISNKYGSVSLSGNTEWKPCSGATPVNGNLSVLTIIYLLGCPERA